MFMHWCENVSSGLINVAFLAVLIFDLADNISSVVRNEFFFGIRIEPFHSFLFLRVIVMPYGSNNAVISDAFMIQRSTVFLLALLGSFILFIPSTVLIWFLYPFR